MNVKKYLQFIRWYFDYIGRKRFDNSSPMIQTVIHVKRAERHLVVIFAYLLIVSSLLLVIMLPTRFWLSFGIMIVAIGLLSLCRFSWIYYFLLYVRYSNKNSSINDNVIVNECILLNPTNEIRKIISQYFRIVDVKGNIFALKFFLSDKRKPNKRKLSRKDIFVLTFKPNAILLDKKLNVGKLHELSDLKRLLCEVQKTITTKE